MSRVFTAFDTKTVSLENLYMKRELDPGPKQLALQPRILNFYDFIQGGNRLDLDSIIVFRTDPIHSTRHVSISDDFGCHHRSAALRAFMRVRCTLVTKAGTRCFGNLFCHVKRSSFLY